MTAKHEWLPDEILRVVKLYDRLSVTEIRDWIEHPTEKRPSRPTIRRHVLQLVIEDRLEGAGRDVYHAQTYRVKK